jgi:hypothetical protein
LAQVAQAGLVATGLADATLRELGVAVLEATRLPVEEVEITPARVVLWV